MATLAGAPKLSNLSEFRSALARGGDPAKVARFSVVIPRAPKDFQFLCEAAELPGRALNAQDYRYYGANFKLPHQTQFTDLNLTFLCRSKMEEKKFFDAWMEAINPKNTYNFNFRADYAVDITVYQYSETGDATHFASFEDAYPINVNPMPLAWAEDNIHRLQVTFAFSQWK